MNPPADTALRLMWQRTCHRAPRSLLFLVVLCVGISLLLLALDGKQFGLKLGYSLCVGTACSLVMDGTRLAVAALSDVVYRARGLPPDPAAFGKGWRSVAIAAPLSALLGPSLGMTAGDWLLGGHSPSLLDWGNRSARLTLMLGVLGTAVSVAVFMMSERISAARAEAEAAQRAAAENQLRLLQSQLEPHMLFNTLANLRVLIGLDAGRAQAMLDRLIAFLRSTLSASRQGAHALADEFRHLDDYLALMAIRMGPRLAVAFELPPSLAALPVPPLLLQPLVENAIKHGLEPKVEGGRIAVSAQREGQTLVLRVRDTGIGPGAAATAGTGFGLEQVRQRLATLHRGAASLTLAAAEDAEGGTLVTLVLPLPTLP